MVTNAQCADMASDTPGTKADSLIVKIIANSNALTLNNDDKDSSTTAGNLYKGVELYPSSDASGAAKGMFGMNVVADTTGD